MKLFVALIIWCVLLAFLPAVAIAVAVLYPIALLIALPFKIAGICVSGLVALLKAIIFLPARAITALC